MYATLSRHGFDPGYLLSSGHTFSFYDTCLLALLPSFSPLPCLIILSILSVYLRSHHQPYRTSNMLFQSIPRRYLWYYGTLRRNISNTSSVFFLNISFVSYLLLLRPCFFFQRLPPLLAILSSTHLSLSILQSILSMMQLLLFCFIHDAVFSPLIYRFVFK